MRPSVDTASTLHKKWPASPTGGQPFSGNSELRQGQPFCPCQNLEIRRRDRNRVDDVVANARPTKDEVPIRKNLLISNLTSQLTQIAAAIHRVAHGGLTPEKGNEGDDDDRGGSESRRKPPAPCRYHPQFSRGFAHFSREAPLLGYFRVGDGQVRQSRDLLVSGLAARRSPNAPRFR